MLRFDQARLAALVTSVPELSVGLARQALDRVLELPVEEQDVLLETLAAWFDTDGSPADAGRRLHCHRNTVRYRLNKLAQLTGCDLRKPGDITRLYLALEAVRLLPDQVRG
ncbi:CdaR family transcriptional regulator [Saccharomonospora sp. CUA-673]|uniref:PucR family transcriptional regulator n=1 Tax=Saccharomonospora sp. CUA-673 TaxID=1904969 RepID=UPI0013019BD7|nr:helix-turn-helix domain-containing protein [Saccharomonospora sp. CUA-673]